MKNMKQFLSYSLKFNYSVSSFFHRERMVRSFTVAPTDEVVRVLVRRNSKLMDCKNINYYFDIKETARLLTFGLVLLGGVAFV